MNEKIDQIISLIFMTRRVMHEQIRDHEHKNFSSLHFVTLQYVKENKPPMKELAEFLSITPPSATSLVNSLVESKMIERTADESDRRIVRIDITKKGDGQMKKCKERMTGHMKQKLMRLNEGEQKELIKILTKITEA